MQKSKTASKKAKKVKEGLEKEWEEWQKKDSKFVNEVYEEQVSLVHSKPKNKSFLLLVLKKKLMRNSVVTMLFQKSH